LLGGIFHFDCCVKEDPAFTEMNKKTKQQWVCTACKEKQPEAKPELPSASPQKAKDQIKEEP
jgi:hypothetical protein